MSKPKLMIMGHARHGKDTVCEILRDYYGYSFVSSSRAAIDFAIWPIMERYYPSKEDCFNDRHNWRALWFELIRRFNHKDPAALAREIYAASDIYCGIRSKREFDACKDAKLFDYSVWVDASERLPPESQSSIEVDQSMATITLSNNGDLEELKGTVYALLTHIELL